MQTTRRGRASGGGSVAIVVLAKFPVPGRVKTRLGAAIGTAAASRLYGAFVRDLAIRLRQARVPVWWAFTPVTAPFARFVGSRRCFPQRGTDLGRRIHHAIAVVHRETGGPVIALGADMPHVSRRAIARAAGSLMRGTAVVLGPARDGGYYLIGLGTPERRLFEGIAWSTGGVAAATRRHARALGLSTEEVAPGFDVDDADDLAALARIVRRHPRAFPHTHTTLRQLSESPQKRSSDPLHQPGSASRPRGSSRGQWARS